MSETLKYANGRTMNPQPADRTLISVATQLVDGEPAVVVLEPGDGTRYTLLVVPTWAPGVRHGLGHLGIPGPAAKSYLIVTKLDDTGGASWFAAAGVGTWDLAYAVKNEWSRELLAWWLRHLWTEIRRVRPSDGGGE